MMKKILFSIALIVSASACLAQQATITSVVVPSETKIVVSTFEASRDCICATIEVVFQDSNSLDQRRLTFKVPADPANPGTEFQTLLGAMLNPRAGETGVNGRKMNFRILGYLVDSGRLTGVTLVP